MATAPASQPHLQPHHPPQPHTSTLSHLSAETAVLKTLYDRSKAQHRSQVWLPRLAGVLRLAKLLIHQLADNRARQLEQKLAPQATRAPHDGPNDARTAEVVRRFTTALTAAASLSEQVLALNHFMPLHVMLLASYARLLAVTLALGSTLGIGVDDLIIGTKVAKTAVTLKREVRSNSPKAERLVGKSDVGELVARPLKRKEGPVAVDKSKGKGRANALEDATVGVVKPLDMAKHKALELDDVFSSVPSPEPVKGKPKKARVGELDSVLSAAETPTKKTKVKKDTGKLKSKKKKRDDMDSIFGF